MQDIYSNYYKKYCS